MYARLPVLVVLVPLIVVGTCAAQSADGGSSPTVVPSDTSATTANPSSSPPIALQALSTNALSAWIGGSFATGRLIGNIQEARMGMLGLRFERLLVPASPAGTSPRVTLTYTADAIPAFLLSVPPNTISLSPPTRPSPIQARGLNAFGVGLRPAGLRITGRVANRVQPFLEGSTGVLYFFEPIPSERGKHLNFTFDVGVGVQFVLTPNLLLTAGYRYHHLSNGFRGQINPGVDANLFHLGLAVPQ